MQNKRLYKKLMTIFDWLLLIFPFILLIAFVYINKNQADISGEYFSITNICHNFNDLFGWLNETPIFILFNNLGKKILNTTNNIFTNPVLTSILLYSVYVIFVVLFNMIRNLLLLIPIWFNDILKK